MIIIVLVCLIYVKAESVFKKQCAKETLFKNACFKGGSSITSVLSEASGIAGCKQVIAEEILGSEDWGRFCTGPSIFRLPLRNIHRCGDYCCCDVGYKWNIHKRKCKKNEMESVFRTVNDFTVFMTWKMQTLGLHLFVGPWTWLSLNLATKRKEICKKVGDKVCVEFLKWHGNHIGANECKKNPTQNLALAVDCRKKLLNPLVHVEANDLRCKTYCPQILEDEDWGKCNLKSPRCQYEKNVIDILKPTFTKYAKKKMFYYIYGPPGAGKSTIANSIKKYNKPFLVVDGDNFRATLDSLQFLLFVSQKYSKTMIETAHVPTLKYKKWTWCKRMMKKAIDEGRTIIFSAIKQKYDFTKFKKNKYTVVVVHKKVVQADSKEILYRTQQRSKCNGRPARKNSLESYFKDEKYKPMKTRYTKLGADDYVEIPFDFKTEKTGKHRRGI